jgi:YVTN family beta-propeller protein
LRSLSLIDTTANESPRIVVGDLPRCVPISPDGKRAYLSGFGDHMVSVIDVITHRVTNTVDVGGHPEGLAVSPDGDRPYVSDYWAGTVSVISTRERNPAGAPVIRVLERASLASNW